MQDHNIGDKGSMEHRAGPKLMHHRRKHLQHYRFSGYSDTRRELCSRVQLLGLVKEGQGMNTGTTTVFQDKRYVALGPTQGERVGVYRAEVPLAVECEEVAGGGRGCTRGPWAIHQ